MPNALRFLLGSIALVASAACAPSSQPELTDDLKQDLAKVGGGDVQLAGASSAPGLQVVTAAERPLGATPAVGGPSVTRVASATHGKRAVVKSRKKESPVVAESPAAETVAPVLTTERDVAPEPVPVPQSRPQAPVPSTQREPRGGWKTPGQVIRNAPFPINP